MHRQRDQRPTSGGVATGRNGKMDKGYRGQRQNHGPRNLSHRDAASQHLPAKGSYLAICMTHIYDKRDHRAAQLQKPLPQVDNAARSYIIALSQCCSATC